MTARCALAWVLLGLTATGTAAAADSPPSVIPPRLPPFFRVTSNEIVRIRVTCESLSEKRVRCSYDGVAVSRATKSEYRAGLDARFRKLADERWAAGEDSRSVWCETTIDMIHPQMRARTPATQIDCARLTREQFDRLHATAADYVSRVCVVAHFDPQQQHELERTGPTSWATPYGTPSHSRVRLETDPGTRGWQYILQTDSQRPWDGKGEPPTKDEVYATGFRPEPLSCEYFDFAGINWNRVIGLIR